MTDKKTVMPRDSNLRYVKPTHYTASAKKLSKANPEASSKRNTKTKSASLKSIKSHEDIDDGLKAKLKEVFAKGLKSPLSSQKALISQGYKLENLAGEKVVKLSSVLDKKGNVKKWGDLSVLYIHNFLAEGFKVVLGQHPKYPADPDKTAIYIK